MEIDPRVYEEYDKAVAFYNSGHYREAAQAFDQLASKSNYGPAIYMYGICARDGLGIPIDTESAIASFTLARCMGVAEAQQALNAMGNYWDSPAYQYVQNHIINGLPVEEPQQQQVQNNQPQPENAEEGGLSDTAGCLLIVVGVILVALFFATPFGAVVGAGLCTIFKIFRSIGGKK